MKTAPTPLTIRAKKGYCLWGLLGALLPLSALYFGWPLGQGLRGMLLVSAILLAWGGIRSLRNRGLVMHLTPHGLEGDMQVPWTEIRTVRTDLLALGGPVLELVLDDETVRIVTDGLRVPPAHIHDAVVEFASYYAESRPSVQYLQKRILPRQATTCEIGRWYGVAA